MIRFVIVCAVGLLVGPAWALGITPLSQAADQTDSQADQILDLLGRVTLPQAASVRGALAEDRIFHTDPGNRRYETRVRYAPDWVEVLTIDHDPQLGDIPQGHLVDDGTENRSFQPTANTGSRGPSRVSAEQVGLEQMVTPEGWVRWATSHAGQLTLTTEAGRATISGLNRQLVLSTNPVRVLEAATLDRAGSVRGHWSYEDDQPVGAHDEHPRRVHHTMTNAGQVVVDRVYEVFAVEPIDPAATPEQVAFRSSTAVDDLFEGRRVRWGTGETVPGPTPEQVEQLRRSMRRPAASTGSSPSGATTRHTLFRRWPIVAFGVGLILAGLILWHIRRG